MSKNYGTPVFYPHISDLPWHECLTGPDQGNRGCGGDCYEVACSTYDFPITQCVACGELWTRDAPQVLMSHEAYLGKRKPVGYTPPPVTRGRAKSAAAMQLRRED